MLQPTFTITALEETDGYTKFAIEPLEKGYGQTLGVGLRRVLLSSIEGAAISSVRLDGVQHQFTTITGMKEDVVDFILNLKQLNFSLNESADSVSASLNVKGPKTVTGADLNLPGSVTLGNPDLPLAVLADAKSKLSAEIVITRGRGYSPASDRPSNTLGEIPVDAAFSPVRKVAYRIEATRVGRRTDYDKLILEIWTNNTVAAKTLLNQAAKILVNHFQQVYEPVITASPKDTSPTEHYEDEVYKLTVEELDLPTRIANALRKGGYKTVRDLTGAYKADIAKVKNLGEKSVGVVSHALSQKGLHLADDI